MAYWVRLWVTLQLWQLFVAVERAPQFWELRAWEGGWVWVWVFLPKQCVFVLLVRRAALGLWVPPQMPRCGVSVPDPCAASGGRSTASPTCPPSSAVQQGAASKPTSPSQASCACSADRTARQRELAWAAPCSWVHKVCIKGSEESCGIRVRSLSLSASPSRPITERQMFAAPALLGLASPHRRWPKTPATPHPRPDVPLHRTPAHTNLKCRAAAR